MRSFRNSSDIAVYRKGEWAERGEITLEAAAEIIGVAKITVLRMIRRGHIKGRQPCKGAPWVIKADDMGALGADRQSKGSVTPNPVQEILSFNDIEGCALCRLAAPAHDNVGTEIQPSLTGRRFPRARVTQKGPTSDHARIRFHLGPEPSAAKIASISRTAAFRS